MNSWLRTRFLPLTFAASAAILLLASLRLPLWQLRMEAPQYRDEEALRVAVYPGALRGDLDEIKTLNQYIGVHIPRQLPQLRWLPAALVSAGALGLGAVVLPRRARRRAWVVVPALLALALTGAALQAQSQMYDIGHKRDPKTTLAGVKDFTPPLLGKTKIAQFELTARLGLGAYLAGAAMGLQLAAAGLSRQKKQTAGGGVRRAGAASLAEAGLPGSVPCPSGPSSR
jgi:hypothetical protein